MHKVIKNSLHLGNACCHSVQSLLSSYLLCKNFEIKIYKTISLLLVLYACETWSLIHEKIRDWGCLRMVSWGEYLDLKGRNWWKKLHDEKLHNLYTSPNIIWVIKSRRMKCVGHVACMGEMRNSYSTLLGKPNGKSPLWRPRHRWEYNIRMNLREIGWKGLDWIYLAQDRD